MMELEVTGSVETIDAVKQELVPFSEGPIRTYRHGGAAGEAGIFGAVLSIATAMLPKILELLKPLVARDRTLKVSVNGMEFTVRDMGELDEVMGLLSERGLLPKG